MSVANVSGFGATCNIVSTATFPYGFSLSKLADDVDPIVVEDLEIKKFEMLLDGSMLSYRTANPVLVSLSVIAGSVDDANLGIILSASQIRGKLIRLPDTIWLTVSYPDNTISTFTRGAMLSGPPAKSVLSSGRYKTSTYKFAFTDSTSAGAGAVSSLTSIGNTVLRIL